jgi:hypothetical protein
MFGISTLGLVHTLGSLPAIPLAGYMLVRYGRIVPRSTFGLLYFVFMLIGALTVFPVAHEPISYVIAIVTLALLFAGYSVGRTSILGRFTTYAETICLSLSVFLLMLPTITEILRRVPDGHPIVTDIRSPLLLGAQGLLLVLLLVGLAVQVIAIRRRGGQ